MIDDLTLLCSSLFVFAMEMCVGERKRAIEKEVRKMCYMDEIENGA